MCLPRFFQTEIRKQLLQAVRRRLRLPTSNNALLKLLEDADRLGDKLDKTYWLHERNPEETKRKAGKYREILPAAIDRINVYRQIGRLERMHGNDLIGRPSTPGAAPMRPARRRSLSRTRDWVKPVLLKNGYIHEAAAVDALYSDDSDRHARCRQLLDAAYERCKPAPLTCEFSLFNDYRGNVQPRVSVIVSLYNAAEKMPVFIEALRQQTILRKGVLELILVDSASPLDEEKATRQSLDGAGVPYLFVRTPERESIQTAWNRGIALARGKYLAFLGVDETVLPTAFEELAHELDSHPDVDWVMADSLVMSVDAKGNPDSDVMVYDREGYTQDHVYLETCYLSWVGGLYRRSIHERFGYYDGTYRAAGDTEFKGRVLPHIKSRHVPRVLGVFLNYPEERTTASPRAELEDYRAWYLHRSPAGVRYAFDRRDVADLEAMLPRALNYRKSYCRHISSDVEYASAIHGSAAASDPRIRRCWRLAGGVERLLAACRSLDLLAGNSPSHARSGER